MQLLTLLFALVATFLVVLAIVFDIIEPGQRWRRTGGRAARGGLSPGEGFDNLFWFVQISDIHLSIFRDLQRGPDLIRYCHQQLKVVQPHLVIISGDLVDAKTENSWGSKQYEEEWRQYEKIVEECTQDKKWVWLDVRGNHDAFDVPDLSSPSNFYRLSSSACKQPLLDLRTLIIQFCWLFLSSSICYEHLYNKNMCQWPFNDFICLAVACTWSFDDWNLQ